MSTIARGNAAEAAVIHALELSGIVTLVPFGGGCPFDVAALLPDGSILRVQVKCGRLRNGCVAFNTHSTDHGHGRQTYHGRADVIAVAVLSIGRVFIIPVDDCPSFEGLLRVDLPKNNQRKGVRFAEDYSFERWLESLSPAAAAA